MRVAVYYKNTDIRIEERPVPQIGHGEMLVRIEASGICGSDLMEWYRINKVPLVLGHEVAGEIVAVGAGVQCFNVGDRVVAAHHVPCNTCYYCIRGHHTACETLRKTNFDPGGFSEYLRLPSINVDRGTFLIPDEVSYEDATFTEPLACVLRAQRKVGIEPGQSVLVIGSGISGLLHIQLAYTLGAGLIAATARSDFSLNAAKLSGANITIRAKDYIPDCLRQVNNGRLADIVIICTSATEAFTHALQSVERGGTVLFFAPTNEGVTIPLSVNQLFWRNDITLTTSYAGSPADHIAALELIRAHRVNVRQLITHRLSLNEIGKGFDLAANAHDCIKVIVEPQK